MTGPLTETFGFMIASKTAEISKALAAKMDVAVHKVLRETGHTFIIGDAGVMVYPDDIRVCDHGLKIDAPFVRVERADEFRMTVTHAFHFLKKGERCLYVREDAPMLRVQ